MGYLYIVGTEERSGCLGLGRLEALAITHDGIEERALLATRCKILLTIEPEAVEASAVGKAFKGFAVDIAEVHALGKVIDIGKGAIGLALVDDGGGGSLAHTLDGSQSEAYLALLVG